MSHGLCSAMNGLSLTAASSFLTGAPMTVSSVRARGHWNGLTVEAAHKKGAGSTKNGRDSISKRRGVKVFGMQKVKAGGIIIRQLGTKWHPGANVGIGRDYTIYAKQEGLVMFERGRERRKLISVYSEDHPKIQAKLPPPVERNGPTRKERWRASHTPRAILRERAAAAEAQMESIQSMQQETASED